MATYHENCYEVMKSATIFPLEMDLSRDAFAYKSEIINTGESEDDDDDELDAGVDGSDAVEFLVNLTTNGVNLIEAGLVENIDALMDLGNVAGKKPQLQENQKDVFDLISIE